MDANASIAMFPLRRCKIIHLVRHAQGVHNVEGETDHSAYMKPEFFDAHVTPLGWNQVDCLREKVKKCGLAEKVELVICSPLMRTMQTAVGVFGGEHYSDGVIAPLLMVENAGNSGRPAISSSNSPPFLAVEACRERLGVHPCDKRRSLTEYRALFPAIDFSLIENDEDVLWEKDVRETYESLAARGMKFIDWLWTREEKEIAVVTHSGLLWHTLRMYSKECHPTVRDEVSKYLGRDACCLAGAERRGATGRNEAGAGWGEAAAERRSTGRPSGAASEGVKRTEAPRDGAAVGAVDTHDAPVLGVDGGGREEGGSDKRVGGTRWWWRWGCRGDAVEGQRAKLRQTAPTGRWVPRRRAGGAAPARPATSTMASASGAAHPPLSTRSGGAGVLTGSNCPWGN